MSHQHNQPQNQASPESTHALSSSGFDGGETGQLMAAPPFQLQAGAADAPPTQLKASSGGLDGGLVNGFAATSGHDLSDVNVHRNSSKPSEVGALAYAQGNDIHLGPGQDKHLPHEAAHIVQQREGRVKPTTEVNGMAVNDNAGLESEADRMGEQAAQMKANPNVQMKKGSSSPAAAQMKVAQLKKVPTEFGEFETETFEKIEEKGVEIVLKFNPHGKKVNATKIGMTQAYVGKNKDGSNTGVDPTTEGRRVKEGPGENHILDRLSTDTSPIYGVENQSEGKGLEDTPENDYSKFTVMKKKVGQGGMKYELGHAYKQGLLPKKKAARMYDAPEGGGDTQFETTALAIEGEDEGQYYGSVKWGYKVENGKVEINDIELASAGDPTVGFQEAAKAWNESTVRGTLEVVGDNSQVWDSTSGNRATLPKGTQGKQSRTGEIEGVNVALVEILDANGNPSGREYYIAVADMRDMGDGKSTIDLPLPSPEKKSK
jgi:hypothetical protein